MNPRPIVVASADSLGIFAAEGFAVTEHTAHHSSLERPDLHIDHWRAREGDKWSLWGRSFVATPEQVLRAFQAGRFRRPDDAQPGNCRTCGKAIWWVRTSNNKTMPCSPDGAPHFAGRCRP